MDKTLILLKEEFLDHTFISWDVANKIDAARQGEHTDLSEAGQLLVILQDRQLEDNRWYIQKDIEKLTGRLRRLFWMDPIQQEFYHRYHDVILNDNTASTNRFNMPLNSWVIVDANGKSHLIACALTSGETTEDYEWILHQLLQANNGIIPSVILVDEDPAMEAACASTIPDTYVVNCIWHISSLNLNKNLHGAMGSHWENFIS